MIQLRSYQQDAENSIYNYFSNGGKGNPLICIPTAGGKGRIIASFIYNVMQRWANQRFLIITHRKELLSQTSDNLRQLWPLAPYGIYSAGLDRREYTQPIIFAGIASIYKKINLIGYRDIVIIDEAHLVGSDADAMYTKAIADLKLLNPALKVIGFTATPYRMGLGLLINGPLFTDIIFDITGMEAFNRLIADGYLCKPISKRAANVIDTANVGISNTGEFNLSELELAADIPKLNYLVCQEIVQFGANRNCWVVFASGIKHAEHLAEILRMMGIGALALHSKMKGGERDKGIRDFKNGNLRCIVNDNIVSIGFDHPPIDFIADCNPTLSTGKWVQKVGRGMRPSPDTGKYQCLVLDFGGNTARLGPVNDPIIPRPKNSSGKPGTPPIKICPNCGVYNHISSRVCDNCGYEFPVHVKLEETATTEEIIRSDAPQMEWFEVTRINYKKGYFRDKAPHLHVNYICGIRSFDEYVFLEYAKYPLHLAHNWWRERIGSEFVPKTVNESLAYVALLQVPTRILVWLNHRPPKITAVEGLTKPLAAAPLKEWDSLKKAGFA